MINIRRTLLRVQWQPDKALRSRSREITRGFPTPLFVAPILPFSVREYQIGEEKRRELEGNLAEISPKQHDWSLTKKTEPDKVFDKNNVMPMKRLGFCTPYEVRSRQRGVALAGCIRHLTRRILIVMKEVKVVLVVDDMPLNLRTAKVMLEDFFVVLLAKSAEFALSIVKESPIDLILLDIEMPGMNGFDFMEILQTMPEAKDIPVIFVTSHVSTGLINHALHTGVKDYLAKPYKKEVLLKKIYTLIHKTDRFYMTQEGKCILLADATSQTAPNQ
jgi:CheY-like chemotaxis protein